MVNNFARSKMMWYSGKNWWLVNFETVFGVINFFQKTNENKSTWVIIVVSRIRLFVFWRKSMTPKNHFEINWPLLWLKFFTLLLPYAINKKAFFFHDSLFLFQFPRVRLKLILSKSDRRSPLMVSTFLGKLCKLQLKGPEETCSCSL